MPTRRALIAVSILVPALVLARWVTGRMRPKDPVTTDMAIRYGEAEGRELLLDVYSPPQRERPRPAVLLIHGGGFVGGSRADVDIVTAARHLAQTGYVAFAIDYRLVDLAQPGPAWPAPLDDVQRAVRWVRAQAATYGVDPERIGAYGISAGAGLAAHLGVRESPEPADDHLAAVSSRVRCVVALAGPMDGTIPPANPSDLDVAQALFGGMPTQVPAVYRDASPVTHVNPASAPFLVVHGVHDTVVPVAHARRLVAALQAAGIAVDYVEDPDAGHDVFTWERVGARTLAFLGRYLEPDR
jgi:acetyl esterase/lipase